MPVGVAPLRRSARIPAVAIGLLVCSSASTACVASEAQLAQRSPATKRKGAMPVFMRCCASRKLRCYQRVTRELVAVSDKSVLQSFMFQGLLQFFESINNL